RGRWSARSIASAAANAPLFSSVFRLPIPRSATIRLRKRASRSYSAEARGHRASSQRPEAFATQPDHSERVPCAAWLTGSARSPRRAPLFGVRGCSARDLQQAGQFRHVGDIAEAVDEIEAGFDLALGEAGERHQGT